MGEQVACLAGMVFGFFVGAIWSSERLEQLGWEKPSKRAIEARRKNGKPTRNV